MLQGVISPWCQMSSVRCEVVVEVHLFVMRSSRFSASLTWFLKLPSKTGLPGSSLLTNRRAAFQSFYLVSPTLYTTFPEPSLSSLPGHHIPLSLPQLACGLLSVCFSVSLSASPLLPQVSSPVSWSYMPSTCPGHPHYSIASPYILPEFHHCPPRPTHPHVTL